MIVDKTTLFADSLAYDGTPTEIDTGIIRPGPGRPLKCFIQGSADLAGITGFQILSDDTTSPSTVIMEMVVNPVGQILEFFLPSNIERYLNIGLVGTGTAGSFSAGIVMDVQTAM